MFHRKNKTSVDETRGRRRHNNTSAAMADQHPYAPQAMNPPAPTNITIQIPAVPGQQPIVTTQQPQAGMGGLTGSHGGMTGTHAGGLTGSLGRNHGTGFAPEGQTFTTDQGTTHRFGEPGPAGGFPAPAAGAPGGAHSSVNRRVSVGDKMMGRLEMGMGRITGDRKMAAEGQRRVVGGKAAVQAARTGI